MNNPPELVADRTGLSIVSSFGPESSTRVAPETVALDPQRVPGESARAHGRLLDYCRMGVQRSFPAMSRKFGRSPSAYQKMAVRYNWAERVQQYDEAVAALDAEAWRIQLEEAARNRARQELLRQQQAATLSAKAFLKIMRLLDTIGVVEVEKDGKKVLKAKGVGNLMALSTFWREWSRCSILSVEDRLAEHENRIRKPADNSASCELVAGVFSLGDHAWPGTAAEQPAPAKDITEIETPIPPPPARANEQIVPTWAEQLAATAGLYDNNGEG